MSLISPVVSLPTFAQDDLPNAISIRAIYLGTYLNQTQSDSLLNGLQLFLQSIICFPTPTSIYSVCVCGTEAGVTVVTFDDRLEWASLVHYQQYCVPETRAGMDFKSLCYE